MSFLITAASIQTGSPFSKLDEISYGIVYVKQSGSDNWVNERNWLMLCARVGQTRNQRRHHWLQRQKPRHRHRRKHQTVSMSHSFHLPFNCIRYTQTSQVNSEKEKKLSVPNYNLTGYVLSLALKKLDIASSIRRSLTYLSLKKVVCHLHFAGITPTLGIFMLL